MVKYEWKKGDKLEVIDNHYQTQKLTIGDIVILDRDVSTDDGSIGDVKLVGNTHETNEYFPNRFKLAKKGSKSKPQKPIVKHIVIQEDCNNTIGIYDDYKEATSKLPDGSDIYNVYELVHVASVQNAPRVTRIKRVAKKKASKKK